MRTRPTQQSTMQRYIPTALAASALLAAAAPAQNQFPLVPFSQTGDLYVTDAGTDSVFRLADINLDGDFDDLGEITTFYDETLGPQSLGNNNGIAVAGNGVVFLCDTSEDKIFRMLDMNGDGDCHDAGEIVTFFDGDPLVNLSGVEMVSPNKVKVDTLGRIWVAEANNGGGGTDAILILEDKNQDGDANDVGEVNAYFLPTTQGSVGDSIPNDVFIGNDNHVYYIEGGSTGFINKGVYRFDDANGNGFIEPGESTSFFRPPVQPNTPFFWCLTQDADGYWYTADSSNELIWRFRDEDANGTIEAATEAVIWWQSSGSSLIWDLAPDSKGGLYAAESQSPDRILYLFDTNGDGTVDPVTETTEVYSELVSAVNISNPRGIALDRQPVLSLQPTVAPGGTVNILHVGTVGDIAIIFYSNTLGSPVALAPYGYLELVPSAVSGRLFQVLLGEFGFDSSGVVVPNDPGLVGLSLHAQSLVGKPDRFELSNASTVTVL